METPFITNTFASFHQKHTITGHVFSTLPPIILHTIITIYIYNLFPMVLTGKPAGKRSSGRHRHRWENNRRMDLKEIGVNMRNWVESVQGRDYWRALVKETLNLRVP